MNNYEYCAAWVLEQPKGNKARVMDYGCGAGQIVSILRNAGCDAYGCDVFYDGGNYSNKVPKSLFGSVIKRMDGNTIPFDNNSFDIVINNFVMEHVPDIGQALDEIHRVLKPGGVVLSIFPDRGVWREGHCGIPFLHWFPKGSSLRIYYIASMSLIGFGYRADRDLISWSKETCEWLDKWTYYRSRFEIFNVYRQKFENIQCVEEHWLRTRFLAYIRLISFLPVPVQRFFVRRLGALAFVSRKGMPYPSEKY